MAKMTDDWEIKAKIKDPRGEIYAQIRVSQKRKGRLLTLDDIQAALEEYSRVLQDEQDTR